MSNTLQVDGYELFRKDRGSRGGGILVYYKSNISCKWKLELMSASKVFNEILVCEVYMDTNKKFHLVTFYRPPNTDVNFNDNLNQTIENILHFVPEYKTCLVGDLNIPGIQWADMQGNSTLTNSLCDIFNESNRVQLKYSTIKSS